MTTEIKFYSTKDAAKRAAKGAKQADGTFEIQKGPGGFYWQPKPAQAPASGAQAAVGDGQAAQAGDGQDAAVAADNGPVRPRGMRKAAFEELEAARRGELPPEPDFTANTHSGFRKALAKVTTAAQAGDLAALYDLRDGERGTRVPKGDPALDRYLSNCILAVEANGATVEAPAAEAAAG